MIPFFQLQRKNTLLLEYKLQNKVNKFYDRRIGEKNRNMTAEDKVMARFVANRVKSHKVTNQSKLHQTNAKELCITK